MEDDGEESSVVAVLGVVKRFKSEIIIKKKFFDVV